MSTDREPARPQQRQAQQRGKDAEIGVGSAVADEALVADDGGIDVEPPVQEMVEHAVEGEAANRRQQQLFAMRRERQGVIDRNAGKQEQQKLRRPIELRYRRGQFRAHHPFTERADAGAAARGDGPPRAASLIGGG